ncbi:lactate dehydrogenase [Mucilaginibacter sp. 14171R-50]|uniref:lactate dehydrogenase n=1 Tax=Mucilaginibacter sp. 14171R-50 TaxID=2703789 RepID=UPI00138C3335|nr:lactate dehydrogenase [Mucilaginibacter sp. 14171R-50]QHS55292.1 lactate dehydrogenase [Mucilaginibacter sp. 14171R-50]
MKVIAYSITAPEKEHLAKANQKKHDITLIANPLGIDTVAFAAGKDAVIIWNHDDVSATIIEHLAALNVRFIITRSVETEHIDKTVAAKYGVKVANVSTGSLQETADQLIQILDLYQQNKCVGDACACNKNCRAAKNLKIT